MVKPAIGSPRSGRKHKARGASPRIVSKKLFEPAKRPTAVAGYALSPAIAGSVEKFKS